MKNGFKKGSALAVALLAAGLSSSTAAFALEGDLSSMFPVNDIDPKASIPTDEQRETNPVEFGYWLQDMIVRAEKGVESQDWEAAVKYYEALGVALPHNPTSFRKLCNAHRQLGNLDKAEANCWVVLQREGIRVYDHYNYLDQALQLVGSSIPGVKEKRTQMIDQSLDRLRDLAIKNAEVTQAKNYERRDKAADKQFNKVDAVEQRKAEKSELPLPVQIEMYACQLGTQLVDASRLQRCAENLRRVKAEPKIIAMFDWAWKTAAKDVEGQKAALEEAKKQGLPEAALNAMVNPKVVPVAPPKPPVTTLPSDPLAAQAAPNAVQLAAAETEDSPAATAAAGTSKLESMVAGIAALLGLGAGGWLLFKQLSARQAEGRQAPATKQV